MGDLNHLFFDAYFSNSLVFQCSFLDETGRGGFEALVQFPIPPIGVKPVLEKLRDAGVIRGIYTIMLSLRWLSPSILNC
jgi:hypothetical protein